MSQNKKTDNLKTLTQIRRELAAKEALDNLERREQEAAKRLASQRAEAAKKATPQVPRQQAQNDFVLVTVFKATQATTDRGTKAEIEKTPVWGWFLHTDPAGGLHPVFTKDTEGNTIVAPLGYQMGGRGHNSPEAGDMLLDGSKPIVEVKLDLFRMRRGDVKRLIDYYKRTQAAIKDGRGATLAYSPEELRERARHVAVLKKGGDERAYTKALDDYLDDKWAYFQYQFGGTPLYQAQLNDAKLDFNKAAPLEIAGHLDADPSSGLYTPFYMGDVTPQNVGGKVYYPIAYNVEAYECLPDGGHTSKRGTYRAYYKPGALIPELEYKTDYLKELEAQVAEFNNSLGGSETSEKSLKAEYGQLEFAAAKAEEKVYIPAVPGRYRGESVSIDSYAATHDDEGALDEALQSIDQTE